MNYLTRAIVGEKTAIRKRLNDCYAWHRAVWEAFPDRENDHRQFLTRIDHSGGNYQVLLLSEQKPTPPVWGQWETKQISPHFLEADRYRFSLRANATIKRVVRDDSGNRKKNGRRTAIYSREELSHWLFKKARQSGFDVEEFDADPPIAQPFRKNGKSGKHIRVDFRGFLRVLDRDAFKDTFAKGIGPAKAFGFGMLMLEPVRE
jgi:CRISPR system Cascade subunit CasE